MKQIAMTEDEGAEIMALFNQGSEKAFQVIWKKFYAPLVFHVEKYVSDREQAKEIASDALTKCFLRKGQFENIYLLRSFLYVVARNSALDHFRSLKRLNKIQAMYFACHNQENGDNEEIYGELIKTLALSIEKLPPRSKEVIELIYLHELSYFEIAERMQISLSTVFNTRSAAIKKMRKDFANIDIELFALSILFLFSFF